MLMMLNFQDSLSVFTHKKKLVVLFLTGALTSCIAAPPMETPKERVVSAVQEQPKGRGTLLERSVLVGINVRRLSKADVLFKKSIHPQAADEFQSPVHIAITVEKAFDPRPRSSAPVIVLNGRPMENSRVDYETLTRIDLVVDRSRLKQRNTVRVAWIGNIENTLSDQPLVFTLDDIVE